MIALEEKGLQIDDPSDKVERFWVATGKLDVRGVELENRNGDDDHDGGGGRLTKARRKKRD